MKDLVLFLYSRHELARIEIEAEVHPDRSDRELVHDAKSRRRSQVREIEVARPWNTLPVRRTRRRLQRTDDSDADSLFKTTTLLPPVGKPAVVIVLFVAETVERVATDRCITAGKKRSLAGRSYDHAVKRARETMRKADPRTERRYHTTP